MWRLVRTGPQAPAKHARLRPGQLSLGQRDVLLSLFPTDVAFR